MKRKSVFVATSLTGGRAMKPYVVYMVKFLQKRGYNVLSTHNAADDPIREFVKKIGDPTATDDHSFREGDNKWIEECNLFIAEVTTPSHGVGGEFEHCRLKPRMGLPTTPMLCVYLKGTTVSPYIKGVSTLESPYIWFQPYRNKRDLNRILTEFLTVFG